MPDATNSQIVVTRPLDAETVTDRRDIARGAGANILGFIMRLGARLPFLFIVGRFYGNEAYGRYAFAIAVIEICAELAVFGLKRSLFKYIEEGIVHDSAAKREDSIAHALLLALGLGAVFAATILVLHTPIVGWFDVPEVAPLLLVLAPLVPLIAATDVLLAATRAHRMVRYEVMSRSFIEPVVLSIAAVAFYLLGLGALGLALAYCAGLVAALSAAIYGFTRLYAPRLLLTPRLSRRRFAHLLRFSGPTAVHDLAASLFTRIDIFLVAHFFTADIIGIYRMARDFTSVVQKIHYSFGPILAPVLAKAVVENDMRRASGHLAMVSRWVLSVQALIVVVFALFGGSLMGLAGPTFAAGGAILSLLVIGETLNGSFGVVDMMIVNMRPIINPLISISTILFHLAVTSVLAPRIGAEGVALSLVFAYGFMAAARLLVVYAAYRVNIFSVHTAKPIIAALTAGTLWLLLHHWLVLQGWHDTLFGLAVVIGGYLATLYALGLSPEDQAQFAHLRAQLASRRTGR